MTHDEMLMLIVSGAVIVEIVSTFGYLRSIPHLPLLLASFGAMVLASLFTVVEGLLWPNGLNFLEHLSVAIGAILLAWWCALVFRTEPSEKT